MTRKKSSASSLELPEVNFSEDGEIRYLHLGTEWIQGSMFLDRPFDIEQPHTITLRVERQMISGNLVLRFEFVFQ